MREREGMGKVKSKVGGGSAASLRGTVMLGRGWGDLDYVGKTSYRKSLQYMHKTPCYKMALQPYNPRTWETEAGVSRLA